MRHYRFVLDWQLPSKLLESQFRLCGTGSSTGSLMVRLISAHKYFFKWSKRLLPSVLISPWFGFFVGCNCGWFISRFGPRRFEWHLLQELWWTVIWSGLLFITKGHQVPAWGSEELLNMAANIEGHPDKYAVVVASYYPIFSYNLIQSDTFLCV